jgi:hypothetical protein
MFFSSDFYQSYKTFLVKLATPMYTKLGWQNKQNDETLDL